MNFRALYLILPVLVLLLSACEEEMPQYTLSTPEAERNILIEEFTGVRCVNCPAGSAEIENLKALYGESLVAVSIHAGFFAVPYSSNDKELHTNAGEDIQEYLGLPQGYPTAIVDRTQFEGKDDLHLGKSEWAGAISEEASSSAEVNIHIETNYAEQNRRLEVSADVIVVDPSDETRYLTALITENGVHDTQLTPDGLDENYEHKHVLRTMLSETLGDPLPSDMNKGEVAEMNYTISLPELWVAQNCNVVVFVHRKDSDKRVLQVEEVPIID